MSFILEALKKSEAERRRNQGHDLDALHVPLTSGKPARRLWIFLLLTAFLLNGAAFLWWLAAAPEVVPRSGTPAADTGSPPAMLDQPVPSTADAPSVAPINIGMPAYRRAPAGWDELPAPKQPSLPEVRSDKRSPGRQQRIPFLHELPADVRRQVPELAVTLHYFTADPAARLIRVNGSILREGEMLANRLTLKEITADTVVFRLGDTVFRFGEY